MSSKPIILDSSAWIEILNNGNQSKACLKALKQVEKVYVPTVVIFEVYRKIASTRSEDQALSAVALLSQNHVVDLSREIALSAADLSIEKKLAMADSLVLAHAQNINAMLLTLDNDFSGIPDAQVLR